MNIRDVVEVHGGIDRWRSIEEVCLRISVGGVAFSSKGKGRAIREMKVSVCPRRRHSALGYLSPARYEKESRSAA